MQSHVFFQLQFPFKAKVTLESCKFGRGEMQFPGSRSSTPPERFCFIFFRWQKDNNAHVFKQKLMHSPYHPVRFWLYGFLLGGRKFKCQQRRAEDALDDVSHLVQAQVKENFKQQFKQVSLAKYIDCNSLNSKYDFSLANVILSTHS